MMNQDREEMFNPSLCLSSKFTNTNDNSTNSNLVTRLKMPSISWEKTTQKQALTQKTSLKENTKTEGNKLLSLHVKLRQEADKIRQWKLETETELKQKEKKLKESTQTVENLRKYILEQQIQNENLSLKMQEELSYREEILQKVDSTRELCNILKERVQNLQNQTQHFDANCNELKSQEAEHFENFKSLSMKFQNLNISATEQQNKLKSEIIKYCSDKEKLEKCLEENTQEAERQKMLNMENLSYKECEIKALMEKLNDNENKIAQLEEMILTLNSNIQNLDQEIESKKTRIEQQAKDIDLLTKDKCQLCTENQEVQSHLSEIEEHYKFLKNQVLEQTSQHTKEVESLELELKNVKDEHENLKDLHQKLNTQQANSVKLIEDLKSEKDILILEKANLDSSLKNEIHSKNEVNASLEKKSEQLKNLNRCIIELNDQLDAKKIELSKSELELEEKQKSFEDINKKFTEMVNEKESLEKKLESKNTEIAHLEDKMNLLHEREEIKTEQSSKDLAEIKQENKQLTKSLSDMKVKLTSEEKKCEKYIKELEQSKQKNKDTIEKYETKQDKLQSQIKELKENISKLKDDLEEINKKNKDLLIDKQTFDKMTKQKDVAEKERKQAVDNCEIQRHEMMNTLEKYKQENERIIDLKEKEIEMIRLKNELHCKELENKFKNDLKEQKNEAEKDKQKLNNKLSELNKEIEDQKKVNIELQSKLEKAISNNEMTNQLSNNGHNKTPIFLSRKTPQRSVMVTPQVAQHTPMMKANLKLSRKRKVVFNAEKASFMSDTDSSVSEYVTPYDETKTKANSIPRNDSKIQQKIKENIFKNVKENLSKPKEHLRVVNKIENKDFMANVLAKQIYDEIQPKKTKSGKKTPIQNTKKTPVTKYTLSKSPNKTTKNKKLPEKEESFWFDNDPIFGFEIDD